MAELTLESLAATIAVLEAKVAAQTTPPVKDWRLVAGMFTGSESMKEIDAEGDAIREAEREAARQGEPE